MKLCASITCEIMHFSCECQLLTTFSPITFDCLCKTRISGKMSHFLFNKFYMKYILIYNDTKKKKIQECLFLNMCIWIVSQNFCWQGSWLTDLAYCTVIPWKHLAWTWSSVEEWWGTLFFKLLLCQCFVRVHHYLSGLCVYSMHSKIIAHI